MSFTFNKYNRQFHPLSYKYIDNDRTITDNYNVSLF